MFAQLLHHHGHYETSEELQRRHAAIELLSTLSTAWVRTVGEAKGLPMGPQDVALLHTFGSYLLKAYSPGEKGTFFAVNYFSVHFCVHLAAYQTGAAQAVVLPSSEV